MPRKTERRGHRRDGDRGRFNEAAAHAAENRQHALERGVGQRASMRPRPMPRKTIHWGLSISGPDLLQ